MRRRQRPKINKADDKPNYSNTNTINSERAASTSKRKRGGESTKSDTNYSGANRTRLNSGSDGPKQAELRCGKRGAQVNKNKILTQLTPVQIRRIATEVGQLRSEREGPKSTKSNTNQSDSDNARGPRRGYCNTFWNRRTGRTKERKKGSETERKEGRKEDRKEGICDGGWNGVREKYRGGKDQVAFKHLSLVLLSFLYFPPSRLVILSSRPPSMPLSTILLQKI